MPILTSPIRFGAFEVDLNSGELRKNGVRIHLAEQPLQVLTLLLEHPGELVSREDLHQRLWSSDTFVDFENGLNAAVKRLREALGDSADHPRFIETIPRHGYRFIVPASEIQRPTRASAEPQKSRKWALYAGIALALVSITTVVVMKLSLQQRPSVRTIAVLPFVDMSPAKDQEYFSDGLADELLTALSKIPELRVSARTSSFQFKNKNEDLRKIGSKLNVASVLEGGVRKDGNRIRISVQLINVDDGYHVWSENYDRDLTDIFTIQTDIANSVAESLKVSLLAAKPSAPTGTKDLEAYNAYLQAHYFAERRSRQDVAKSIGYYEQSLKLNPKSAQTWAGLAEALMHQADSSYVPFEEGYGKARVAIERALALDSNSAKAHQCMGWLKTVHDWNWEGANASFQRALVLEPGNATSVWEFGRLAATTGHLDQALELDYKSREIDPLEPTVYLNIGDVAYYMGRQEEAVKALQKANELNPEFPVARAYLTRVYLMQSRLQEALSIAEQETEPPWRLYSLILANHALGRKKEADALLKEFIEKHQDGFIYQIAQIYAYRGDADHTFEWLEKAYSLRDPGLSEIKGDPLLRSIERDQRYIDLLRRMNLGN